MNKNIEYFYHIYSYWKVTSITTSIVYKNVHLVLYISSIDHENLARIHCSHDIYKIFHFHFIIFIPYNRFDIYCLKIILWICDLNCFWLCNFECFNIEKKQLCWPFIWSVSLWRMNQNSSTNIEYVKGLSGYIRKKNDRSLIFKYISMNFKIVLEIFNDCTTFTYCCTQKIFMNCFVVPDHFVQAQCILKCSWIILHNKLYLYFRKQWNL